jgi:hypothetical protein
MYRRTRKYAARRKWHPRQDAAPEEQRAPHWQPPDLRRRITIEDFDGAEPRKHVIELHRTSRIDSYRAIVNGVVWKRRVGWSRVLDGLRRAMPRLASARNLDG